MIIKVCGMREAENIREVESLQVPAKAGDQVRAGDGTSGMQPGIDWMGFIFAPKSTRYVSAPPAYLPSKCRRVGVFVDASVDDVIRHVHDFGLDLIQLHGHESPDYLATLRDALLRDALLRDATPSDSKLRDAIPRECLVNCASSAVPRLIKAFPIATTADLEQTAAYAGLADYFLFDTKAQLPGGNGTKFDWSVLFEYHDQTPFLLSGGIGPDDATRVLAFRPPRCIGIDLNSRFELSPALKDIAKLRAFLQSIKS